MKNPLYMNSPLEHLPTVQELWQQCYDNAHRKIIDSQHLIVLQRLLIERECLLKERISGCGKFGQERKSEHLSQWMAVSDKIDKLTNEYGYPLYELFIYNHNGKSGLKDIHGNITLEPLYEDFVFTCDDNELDGCSEFVAMQDGKWGIVDIKGNVRCPFEYDKIIRVPNCFEYYLVMKDGKQGVWDTTEEAILIPVEMDAIHTPGYKKEPFFFTKGGKWGWYWSGDDFYNHHQPPLYDEIFYMNEEEWLKLDDEDEEFFEARIGDNIHYILEWTIK